MVIGGPKVFCEDRMEIYIIIHRLKLDQQYKDDELQAAIDIIESSKDGLREFNTFI